MVKNCIDIAQLSNKSSALLSRQTIATALRSCQNNCLGVAQLSTKLFLHCVAVNKMFWRPSVLTTLPWHCLAVKIISSTLLTCQNYLGITWVSEIFALLCIALLCVALQCFALLCLLSFALLCSALHCFAYLCIASHCFALHCFGVHWCALLFIASPCFALFDSVALFCIASHCWVNTKK